MESFYFVEGEYHIRELTYQNLICYDSTTTSKSNIFTVLETRKRNTRLRVAFFFFTRNNSTKYVAVDPRFDESNLV